MIETTSDLLLDIARCDLDCEEVEDYKVERVVEEVLKQYNLFDTDPETLENSVLYALIDEVADRIEQEREIKHTWSDGVDPAFASWADCNSQFV